MAPEATSAESHWCILPVCMGVLRALGGGPIHPCRLGLRGVCLYGHWPCYLWFSCHVAHRRCFRGFSSPSLTLSHLQDSAVTVIASAYSDKSQRSFPCENPPKSSPLLPFRGKSKPCPELFEEQMDLCTLAPFKEIKTLEVFFLECVCFE